MTSGFHQCGASKPGGERCRRTARLGSKYCHSHRFYRPASRPQPTVSERLRNNWWNCEDCGELLPGSEICPCGPSDAPEKAALLCGPCHRLRHLIEDRIAEIVAATPGQTLRTDKIHDALECFGVDVELVEAARLRMHKDGRLVYGGAGGI